MTTYGESFARHDGIRPNASSTPVVYSALLPAAVIGSIDVNLFPPISATTGTTVNNATDGNTYIYNGTTWALMGPAVVDNPDQTVTIGGIRVAEFNEPGLGPYIVANTPAGLQYTPQPMVVRNLVFTLTPYTPITVYPLEKMGGLGLKIILIGYPLVAAVPNVRYPTSFGGAYVIVLANGGLIFNPGDRMSKIPIGEEIMIPVTISVGDASGAVSLVTMQFHIRQPVLPSSFLSHFNNLVIKYVDNQFGGDSFSLLSKNLAGTDLTAVFAFDAALIGTDVISAISFNPINSKIYAVTKSGPTRTLEDYNPAYIGSAPQFSGALFVENARMAAGEVPATVNTGFTRAGAINQKDGIGFYFNQEAAGVNYAAVVTLPGYVPNTIRTVTQPGVVIPVRDNSTNGVSTMFNRIRNTMAWNPLNNRFYSIAMTGPGVISNIGDVPGVPGTFKLVETALIYSTYNPTDPNPYVGNSYTVYDLTFPGAPPAGPEFAQTAESMFIDNSGMLYVFGVTTGVFANSYLFSVNLALLPNPPVVIVNPSSAIASKGDAAASANALSVISTPDLTLSNGGLPIDIHTNRNSYLSFDTSVAVNSPIVEGTTQRIIKPITISSATPIAQIHFQYGYNYPEAIAPSQQLVHTVLPASIQLPEISLAGRKMHLMYNGPTSIADATTLIEGMRFIDTYKQDVEAEIAVWVVATNGVPSIRRFAYIHVY